ncbi:hypothetical protein MMC10_004776 [Thelotrema lepadinum]|nr:hypothetical protein [Thelotrema lepadinum]
MKGLSLSDSDFTCIWWVYKQSWIAPWEQASYKFLVNIKDGVIVTNFVQAPKNPIIQPGTTPPGSPPTRVSDVLFLTHQALCSNDLECLKRLRWVFHINVSNQETKDVVNRALANLQYPSPVSRGWPGAILVPSRSTTETADQAAVAMLGCPNGHGIAYLLSQHVAQYGHKIIDQVNVFTDSTGEPRIAWRFLDIS